MQHLMSSILYLIMLQCKLSEQGDISWTDVNLTDRKKLDEWPGITDLLGKDPCANGMKYCIDLATIVKKQSDVNALRKDCEMDDRNAQSPNRTVCWIRQKDSYVYEEPHCVR
uniref:Secreted protein n=1 Tax=Cacopsylla melanoneura TaxID=428564 RepID=A0A8D9E108_9HEMI